ncbi:glycosyltransferase family 1 protein [Rhodonellum sp.]|uniref:glycosyltransferase family 4 protein n=1 Tax=Rhodonellum sp. TaxID=2231180 RepID=UPI00271BBAAE|nr:glycosyltransferase family 1 protein [Rhodonellum sp.]MDO9551466.1 glycosyltransferase family 1 protein [Rhodonellum sp.]
MITVSHFNRDPRPSNYTFEQLFGAIRLELSKNIHVINHDIPAGMGRIASVRWAKKNAGKINHITGDVHFLSYGLPSKNTILTVHDLGYYTTTLKGVKKMIYKKFWLEDPFKKVDTITAISQATKIDIMEHFHVAEEKIIIIPDPLLPGFEREQPNQNTKPVIMQIGSGANKNLERLIDAVSGLDVKLLLVNKLFDPRIKAKLLESKVEFEQRTDLSFEELKLAYKDADMLFFASEYEGFGMPIIEAQATGRPVITSTISCMPDVAGDNSALFVDPLSVSEIRNAINTLIESESIRNGIIQNGFQNIQKYSIESIAAMYEKLYLKYAD